ncbi:hypothetical protein HKI87_09g57450 [Chloropicon roscoffensis]|uniref:LAGLIDADG homing endonuclease n=1 Tax=Chloropicon roscoffensis TaxID=1461544 RepID=A0AAX4PDZ9_9CHLO
MPGTRPGDEVACDGEGYTLTVPTFPEPFSSFTRFVRSHYLESERFWIFGNFGFKLGVERPRAWSGPVGTGRPLGDLDVFLEVADELGLPDKWERKCTFCLSLVNQKDPTRSIEKTFNKVFHRGMPSKDLPTVPYYATDLSFKVSLASLWQMYNTDGFVVDKSFKVSVRFLTVGGPPSSPRLLAKRMDRECRPPEPKSSFFEKPEEREETGRKLRTHELSGELFLRLIERGEAQEQRLDRLEKALERRDREVRSLKLAIEEREASERSLRGQVEELRGRLAGRDAALVRELQIVDSYRSRVAGGAPIG